MPSAVSRAGPSGTSDTYGYVGSSETVARIANSGGTTTDSIVSPAGDRLGVKVGATVNWLVPDLHGDIAGSLAADESRLTNGIRYDAWGETVGTGTAAGAPAPVGERSWKYQGRLDISPAGLNTPLYDAGARFYAPGLGTFTQLDSVAGKAQNPLSMNRFLYAEANPATLTDPTGHAACAFDCDSDYDNGGRSQGNHDVNPGSHESQRDHDSGSGPATRQSGGGKGSGDQVKNQTPSVAKTPKVVPYLSPAWYKLADQCTFGSRTSADTIAACNAYEASTPDADGHAVLDTLGMVDPTGIVDGANGVWYASEGDALNAGISFGAATVPYLGDVAKAGRFLKYGDKVVEASLKGSDEVASLVGRTADDLVRACHSFDADTPVATPGGLIPIGEIDVGDEVVAMDPETGLVSSHEVTATFEHDDPVTGTVVIGTDAIETTPGHRFLTADQGWIETQDLRPGDRISSLYGRVDVVGEIRWDGGSRTMFDLTVANVHTFAVGEGGWVVHNLDCSVLSSLDVDPRLAKEAERAGRANQTGLDALTNQLASGNLNPGIGSRSLNGLPGIVEARTRDGARVYFRQSGGAVEILAKSNKSNQNRVISLLEQIYGR